MRYNTLKNGMKISEISFGCMSLKPDEPQNKSLIEKAIDGGINLFDTADLYDKGLNEQLLGNAVKGRRKDILISTKVGNRWRPDGSGWDWNPRKGHILQAVDESLRRLQTDYIDLYLLHGGTIKDPIDEAIEAFERLEDSGKIRGYGLSSIRPNVIREYVQRSNISVVMTQYSLLDRRPEEATLSLLQSNGIGVMARGTVASGLLAGKTKPAKEYLGIATAQVADIQYRLSQYWAARKIEENAIRYVADHPAVTTAVVGIRTEEQLLDALDTANALPMAADEREPLTRLWQGNIYTEHR